MRKPNVILPLALILCFMVGCQNNEAMKAQAKVEEQNVELVSKMITEWNKRNLEFLMEMYAPDYAYYSPSGNPNPVSKEETIEIIKMFWQAFPDITLSVEESMAAGDKVISRFIARGTHNGEFEGISATGNKIEISAINIVRIKNDKIVEEREEADFLGLMMQLGMELKSKEK